MLYQAITLLAMAELLCHIYVGVVHNSIRHMYHATHIDDFLHVIPSKLLTPDETLNTSDRNQKKFTIFSKPEELSELDI